MSSLQSLFSGPGAYSLVQKTKVKSTTKTVSMPSSRVRSKVEIKNGFEALMEDDDDDCGNGTEDCGCCNVDSINGTKKVMDNKNGAVLPGRVQEMAALGRTKHPPGLPGDGVSAVRFS